MKNTAKKVGAGLLAKAVCQTTSVLNVRPIREQARSHISPI